MCCFAPLIKLKMFWEFSRQFMSHSCQCSECCCCLAEGLFHGYSSVPKSYKAQWEKNLAKTGHWQVDLGQSGRWEHQWKLSHCPQKHKLSTNLKTELPAQTCSWSTHQVHPTQYPHLHLVLLLWWPSSVLRFISRTPDTQTCNKALEVTQNSNSSSSKQYPANLWPSNCL